MYNSIFDFCAVKNTGGAHRNGDKELPNRVKFLISLIEKLNLKYDLDTFPEERHSYFKDDPDFERFFRGKKSWWNQEKEIQKEIGNNFHNIYLPGSSPYMIIAHHDIVNPSADNANDNSASVINCLAYKLINPSINVVITDGEEPPSGGAGAKQLSKKIKEDYFGNITGVLNLELTGVGGENFFIGNYPGNLYNKLIDIFDPIVVDTPFNDSATLRSNGIDSVVVTTVPIIKKEDIKHKGYGFRPINREIDLGENEMDFSILYRSHTKEDSVDKISIEDMKSFVEKILTKIF